MSKISFTYNRMIFYTSKLLSWWITGWFLGDQKNGTLIHLLRMNRCRDDDVFLNLKDVILLMEEILHQFIGSLSHYIPGGAGLHPKL